jgi:predicted peroxiredoxin
MAKILYMGSNGSENPTKAVFPFLLANGAVEAGHQAEIQLFGDAVVLIKDVVTNNVVPMGWPPLKDILATTIKNKVPIYV